MKFGIAFLHGISMFGKKNFTKRELYRCIKGISDEDIRIIDMYSNDNVIFEKSDNVHYASVGKKIERVLSKGFGSDFLVTTRSLGTVRGIVEKVKGCES